MLGRIRAGLKAAFLGTAAVNAACAPATQETLLRPDGLRRYLLAAFSTVLACMPPPHAARLPTTAQPALIMGCTADQLMPYRGGKFFYTLGFLDPVSSIEDSARVWRELAGLPDEASVLEIPHRNPWDKTRVTRTIWGEAGNGLQVGLYKIENGGHAEPSCSKRYPYFINKLTGRQNADFEVAEAAWDFFREKRAAA